MPCLAWILSRRSYLCYSRCMTFTEALRAQFGENIFTVADIIESDISFGALPPTVRAAALAGKSIGLALGHVIGSVPGVTKVGRTRHGFTWTVES